MTTGIESGATHDSAYIRSLLWGTKWDNNNLTYAIPYADNNKTWGFYDSTLPQIRSALKAFSDVTKIEFQEINPNSFSADITFFDSYDADLIDAGGIANPPMEEGQIGYNYYTEGDVLLNYNFSENDYKHGKDGYFTLIHEFGHAMGLAHPHDDGGGSSIFPGVKDEDDLGENDLNNVRYTIMSYNDKGFKVLPITPMAFDIAALQAIYGTSDNNTGDNVYNLYNAIDGYYECLWDTGGSDTIAYYRYYIEAWDSYSWGWDDIVIDLRAATLIDGDIHAGGYFSGSMEKSFAYEGDERGGFYIAHGVIIENIKSGTGNDYLVGNHADNHIEANEGDDRIYAQAGNDFVDAGSGDDYVGGGYGNDRIIGWGGADKLNGDQGDDYLNGVNGNDTLNGGAGNDIIYGGYGNDILIGQDGDDKLYGEFNDDKIYGGAGNDFIDAGEGNDFVGGGYGNDRIIGWGGADKLNGDQGDDYLNGVNGNDTLNGGAGNDIIRGGYGRDTLIGQDGDDILRGEYNMDYLYGGDGSDSYYIGKGEGHDHIYETHGKGDVDRIYIDTNASDVSYWFSDRDSDGEKDDFVIGLGAGHTAGIMSYTNGLQVEEIVFNDSVVDILDYIITHNML